MRTVDSLTARVCENEIQYSVKLPSATAVVFFFTSNQLKGSSMTKFASPVTAADLAKNGYRQQWGLIVICTNEEEQIQKYDRLKSLFPENRIKVVTT